MTQYGFLENLSYLWYGYANKVIGSTEMIRNRRQVSQISREIRNSIRSDKDTFVIDSGSRAEGFRFRTSDIDNMIVYKNITVRIKNSVNYHSNGTTLTLEADDTRPGFCLLRLTSTPHTTKISESCVLYQNGTYLSSALWRKVTMEFKSSRIHGPCENQISCFTDIDYAHSLKCLKWPNIALPCIKRLVEAGWPSVDVLSDIIKHGCHFVPIGDKISNKEMLEWRISFSVAERTLIQEMNHCQFLCYGLLKIFLKDVINVREDIEGLICSYFLKTAVLWEIVNNRRLWMMKDFLKLVWVCFRRLLSWVKEGYCPNFFIPENNMFMGKIYGKSHRILLHHLTTLYMEGYICLPKCECDWFQSILCQPRVFRCPVPADTMTWMVDLDLVEELHRSIRCYSESTVSDCMKYISVLHNLRGHDGTFARKLAIDVLFDHFMQIVLFDSVPSMIPNADDNKEKYALFYKFLNSMNRLRIDAVTHTFLSAILLYKLKMYKPVLRLVEKIRGKLQRQNVMYSWNIKPDIYKSACRGYIQPDIVMKKIMVFTWRLKSFVSLPELDLKHVLDSHVLYPPMVMMYFLSFMCHYKLEMYSEAYSVLSDLTSLVNCDRVLHIPYEHKAISVLVLGTCQEICGHLHGAYNSYCDVLRIRHNYLIHRTTKERIDNLRKIRKQKPNDHDF